MLGLGKEAKLLRATALSPHKKSGRTPISKQELGRFGEEKVVEKCRCPKCKRTNKSLVRLPNNFKCADIVCDFCGFLGQVKATRVLNINQLPKRILGAAWRPQEERMQAGIYFPLFLVMVGSSKHEHSIFYLSADLQIPEMFKQRAPLSATARRAGWTGFL
jgi:type II restriction enzyme